MSNPIKGACFFPNKDSKSKAKRFSPEYRLYKEAIFIGNIGLELNVF
jgi:hypothetical protein